VPLPLPGKTVWPPESMEATCRRYQEYATWYGGDPDALARLYGSDSGYFTSGDTRYRQSQFQGGVVGAVARWFWGAPPSPGERRSKLHLPIASDVSTMSADLLFSEPPGITVEDEKTQDRLGTLIGDGGLHSTLIEAAEVASPLGDVYLVGTWDKALRGLPWLRAVHADAVVPEWTWDVLSAATIWTELPDHGDTSAVWRHLERHEPGVILHGLFRGDSQHLGVSVDLEDRDETFRFQPETPTGIEQLTVVHIPNLRPNRLERSSPLGRSDYSPGAIGLMDALDEVWSGLSREFRLAKARAVVSQDAVRPQGKGQGVRADIDREIFVPFDLDPRTAPPSPVQLIQPLIRVEEHISGARALTEQIVRSCGYSLQSFGEGSTVAVTATEIEQRERLSFLTRGKKTLHWGRLAGALEMLLALDVAVFGTKITPERPAVEFGDSVSEPMATTAQTLQMLAAADAASIESRVRIARPEWDDTAVAEEVERIYRETGRDVPDPTAVYDAPGDGQDMPGI
jgi:hypothetical protein